MTERIVIVGGGSGGTITANRLSEELESEIEAGKIEITVVSANPNHLYKPLYLYIPLGEAELEDTRRPLVDLVDHRVTLVYKRVTEIDTDGKSLAMDDGSELDYDYLVVGTGAIPQPEETPGLGEDEPGHHFYGPDASENLRETLANFDEGHLVLSVIGTPHVCPAAPVEFPMIVEEWFRERGVREDIEITYTYPIQRLHGVRPTAEWMVPRFEERDIETKTFFNVENVEDGTIETLEGKELDFDLMIGIPEFTASPIIEEAGLGEEWMEVDRNTLESEHAEDVWGIGDVTNLPTSKAGSVAHYASGTLVSRIASEVRDQVPTATFHGKTICFIEAGTEEGTFIEFAYDREPVVRDENRFLHWSKLGYNEAYWLTARGVM
ncbi:NAD(P)/FAD-dependent oxidoreductase [Halodesulfurarchaeum sp.]|uniref:NAD(P)/FAD-dependent oxidoreductase n=1 Tax=Halodesulfurarchaeum sp. TaxID=1980530 RepID=UPI001BBB9704|nr:FAD-dependent oxidoreductase [Halodesulfurarchaeum sp.]